MTAIGIYGSEGRMGRVIATIAEDEGARIAGGVDAGGDPVPLAHAADVRVDFSTPAALESHLAAAVAARTPMVIGTTGLLPTHHAMIDRAAQEIAVLQTGNTSLGVTLLGILVQEAAQRLGSDWDIEIVEMHHRHKVDAPSGTAVLLGEAAGRGGAQPRYASLRAGDIVGEHLVQFATMGERVELVHRATNRDIFARGALHAASRLAHREPGLYRVRDLL